MCRIRIPPALEPGGGVIVEKNLVRPVLRPGLIAVDMIAMQKAIREKILPRRRGKTVFPHGIQKFLDYLAWIVIHRAILLSLLLDDPPRAGYNESRRCNAFVLPIVRGLLFWGALLSFSAPASFR
jgi:hypothetical protein